MEKKARFTKNRKKTGWLTCSDDPTGTEVIGITHPGVKIHFAKAFCVKGENITGWGWIPMEVTDIRKYIPLKVQQKIY